jgi:hypothetical protein
MLGERIATKVAPTKPKPSQVTWWNAPVHVPADLYGFFDWLMGRGELPFLP